MSTQPVVTESRQLKPRARVRAGARSKAPASAPGVLRPFDRALAASLQRRAEAVEPVAMPPAVTPRAHGWIDQTRVLLRTALRSCELVLTRLNARRTAQGARRLQIVERVSLGEKQAVAILAIQGVQYLVGQGPGGISLLARLDEPSDGAVAPVVALSALSKGPKAEKQGKVRQRPARTRTRETQ